MHTGSAAKTFVGTYLCIVWLTYYYYLPLIFTNHTSHSYYMYNMLYILQAHHVI